MSSRPELKLDWYDHDAAAFACLHWHYSKAIPRTRLFKLGVWEQGVFIGAIIFSRGANNNLGRPYGLSQFQCAELVRVALTRHYHSVTRMISVAIRILKKNCPGIRLIVSFADPEMGHNGSIYAGGNWIYTGKTTAAVEHIVNGRRMHGRAVRASYGHSNFPKIMGSAKHRYLMPLDDEIRKRIEPLRKTYPKRAGSDTKDTAGHQPAKGGSTPTPALHHSPSAFPGPSKCS